MSSQNHFEKFLISSQGSQCKQVLQSRLWQSWLTQSRPRASTPENAALQGILINLAAFKTLIKIRSTSSHFCFFNCFYFLFSNIITTCSPHCNSPVSPSILFPDLLKFFTSCTPSTGKQKCCLLSLPPGWSSRVTDISSARDFPHHGFPLTTAAAECCLQWVRGLCTHGAVPAELLGLLLLLNTHRRACLSWNNTVLFQFSFVDMLQWNKTD